MNKYITIGMIALTVSAIAMLSLEGTTKGVVMLISSMLAFPMLLIGNRKLKQR